MPTCSAGPRDHVDDNGQGGSALVRHKPTDCFAASSAKQVNMRDESELASVRAAKRQLRQQAVAARAELDDAWRTEAAQRALLRLMPLLQLETASVMAAFWPIGYELDTRPLYDAMAALGIATALPWMAGKSRPLVFRRFRPGDGLFEGLLRVLEPAAQARELQPSIVIVPFLAFDDRGYRLGYGGGFYDRTLPTLPAAQIIGLGFSTQRTATLPLGPGDVRLPVVVTDAAVHHFP